MTNTSVKTTESATGPGQLTPLIVLHAVTSLCAFLLFLPVWDCSMGHVGYGASTNLYIIDGRHIDRGYGPPVLLAVALAVLAAYALLTAVGLFFRKRWARVTSWLTPFACMPFWSILLWFVALCVRSNEFSYGSTDPAYPGNVIPLYAFQRAALYLLPVWAICSLLYWWEVQGVRDEFPPRKRLSVRGMWASAGTVAAAVVVVTLLLINIRMADGRMLIHDMADYGWTKAVNLCVLGGQNVNVRDKYGRTPVHYAASEGRLATISLLLDRGADMNARDNEGHTPAHVAALGIYSLWDGHNRDCIKAITLLEHRGADVSRARVTQREAVKAIKNGGY
jgi:hypothetical protein